MAKKLLELLLSFGLPSSLRNDPGTEFTAEVVQHLCKWLNVAIDYGPTGHPRTQGTAERLGGWLHETFVELCKVTPFRLLFGRDYRTQIISSPTRARISA